MMPYAKGSYSCVQKRFRTKIIKIIFVRYKKGSIKFNHTKGLKETGKQLAHYRFSSSFNRFVFMLKILNSRTK